MFLLKSKIMIEKIKRWPIVAWFLRMLYPYNSTCYICGLPWAEVEHHVVPMGTDVRGHRRGFFCVCEYCWNHAEKRRVENGFEKLYHSWCEMTHGNPHYELTDMYIAFDKEWDKTHKD